jgi:hypothetical protein
MNQIATKSVLQMLSMLMHGLYSTSWFIQHKENQNIMTDKAQNEANYITIILSTYLLLLLLMRFLVA